MAENYSFFNSKDHDRTYNARHWADYFLPLFKSGVFNGDLQVVANGGMTVKIKSGYAWIDGYSYHLTDGLPLNLETASGNLNRADSIVIRLDLTNRWIKAFCKTGSYYAGTGVPPTPEIKTTVHELVIARINIPAGTTKITQDMIEDTRMDEALCGWVCGTVKQIEFQQIFEQFKAFQEKKAMEIQEFQEMTAKDFSEWEIETKNEFKEWIDANKESWSGEIRNWFNNLKEELSDNVAVNLQEQIGNLSNLHTEHKENLTEAINEVKNMIRTPVNHLMATEEGSPLDAAVGPVIKEMIDSQNLSFANSIAEIYSNLSNYIRILGVNKLVTVPANGYYHIENLTVSIPEGYKVINFLTCKTNIDKTFCFTCDYTSTGINAYIQNLSSSQREVKCEFKILAIKTLS